MDFPEDNFCNHIKCAQNGKIVNDFFSQATATVECTESEMEDQEIFVPLKQIGKMQKNALAEATAMAKMKDEHFELVVNIQKFTPEEVKVYVEGQSVVVQAKKCTQEGFVTDAYENKFNLPEDVDVSRLV